MALPGNNLEGYGISYSRMFSIDQYIKFGGTIGYTSFNGFNQYQMLPLSVDFTGDLTNKTAVVPFYQLGLGYAIGLSKDSTEDVDPIGGILFHAAVGIRGNGPTVQPFLSLGIRLQNFSYSGTDEYSNTDRLLKFERYQLSAGLVF